jgi:UDP-N-acetylglucosamine 4,6-dehydratase/5-epimerase
MNLDYLKGKSVLVTGGTGSFGQKCVRTLLEQSAARRVKVFSRDELKQYNMQAAFAEHDERLRFLLGDVRDEERLKHAFYGVDYVIHAAALKQVPMLEYNPFEAIKTNIIGTKNVINAAIEQGVEKVMLISTDKAANPANLYGATKLCAERLIVSGNSYGGNRTKFSAVRYGNVLGSRGSIVKLLDEQKKTGVVNLTHEEMTRFWITLDQGVALVLKSLERMNGGEIFVPKLPSMKLLDFMKTLAPDCRINVIGIRPGEKLHEAMVTPEESRHTRELEDHYVIYPEFSFGKDVVSPIGGEPLEQGFAYTSDTNSRWLDEDGLKTLLDIVAKD